MQAGRKQEKGRLRTSKLYADLSKHFSITGCAFAVVGTAILIATIAGVLLAYSFA